MAPRKKKEENKDPNPLLDAMKFVAIAQLDMGAHSYTHCRVQHGYVSGFDGIIAAGHPYEDEMIIAPHTKHFLAALELVKGQTAFAMLPNGMLHVKDDKKFSAMIPTMPLEDVQAIYPDPMNWPLNDKFRQAAAIAGIYTTEGATRIVEASLMTTDGTLLGTNGIGFIEAMHGNPTPPNLIIPKQFFAHLEKIKKPLQGFGFSDRSFTVWFDDKSWLRTQLYTEGWPDVSRAFEFFMTTSPQDVDKAIFEAVRNVSRFSKDGRVYFAAGQMQSHRDASEGATYKVSALQEGQSFAIKFLLAVEPFITQLDYTSPAPVATFYGKSDEILVRGLLSKSN